ncbi:hypothetical protein [Streptomyces sp. NPDC088400]|uniref:hypothetical protein n=1 Tax=Streptomyces sp. NPDC088400 TaxID=3365861 RepID=UPI0037FEE114
MPEDNGAATAGTFAALAMIPFAGGVMAAQKIAAEFETMGQFKTKVDELLVELEESEASPDKVSGDRLLQSHLGTPALKESAYLYGAYTIVHDELERLSKMLAMQMEGLSIAVQASRTGYESIDEDIRQRMRRLGQESRAYQQEQAQQAGAQQGDGGARPDDGKQGF